MNNHIDELQYFFLKYADNAEKNNILNHISKNSISIDFSSKSRQGDISSNFYLVCVKKIKDIKFDLQKDLIKSLYKLNFVENCVISKNFYSAK